MAFRILIVISVLIPFLLTSCDEDDPSIPQEEHFKAYGLVLISSGATILRVFEGNIDESGATELTTPIGLSDHINIKFLDESGSMIEPPDEEDHTFGYIISDESVLEVYQEDGEEWEFHLKGLKAGETEIELQVRHLDHPDFRTPKIPVKITE